MANRKKFNDLLPYSMCELEESSDIAIVNLKNSNINFIAFDFDCTLLSINTGHWNVNSQNYHALSLEASLKVRPLFKVLIPKLISNGFFVAIVSFSNTGIIEDVLKQCFGDEIAAEITVRDNHGIEKSWTYKGQGSRSGKQMHLASAAEHLHLKKNVQITKASTVLVDDDNENIFFCLSERARAIQFDPNTPDKLLIDFGDLN